MRINPLNCQENYWKCRFDKSSLKTSKVPQGKQKERSMCRMKRTRRIRNSNVAMLLWYQLVSCREQLRATKSTNYISLYYSRYIHFVRQCDPGRETLKVMRKVTVARWLFQAHATRLNSRYPNCNVCVCIIYIYIYIYTVCTCDITAL